MLVIRCSDYFSKGQPNERITSPRKSHCYVSTEFQNISDKGGAPYVLHCLAVMEGVRPLGYSVMTAAVLHDLLEDRPSWTVERLLTEGFSEQVVGWVVLLTKPKGADYAAYVTRAGSQPETRAIKLADLAQNMTLTRLQKLDDKVLARLAKYHAAYLSLLALQESN